MEILQGEIKSLQAVKERLKQRNFDLEDELKKTKEEAEKMKAKFEEEVKKHLILNNSNNSNNSHNLFNYFLRNAIFFSFKKYIYTIALKKNNFLC